MSAHHMTQGHHTEKTLTARLNRAQRKHNNQFLKKPQHMQRGRIFLASCPNKAGKFISVGMRNLNSHGTS